MTEVKIWGSGVEPHNEVAAWGKLLAKHGGTIPEWTQLVVERMLACGIPAMGSRRYCCASPHCTHTKYISYSCKGKGSKLPLADII